MDYYDILGVPKDASQEDIKKAFRKLAHTYHPDKQGGDEKKFKEANEAYQVLSNKERRAQYDRFGKTPPGMGGGAYGQGPFGFDFGDMFRGQGAPFGAGGFEDLGDIFGSIFGGSSRASRRTGGMDIQADIVISLQEAYVGTHKKVSLKTYITCETCKGIGHEKSAGTTVCDTCKGSGKIRQQKNTFLGSFVQIQECEKCHGKGHIPKKLCHVCKGTGRVMGERRVDIDIKAGVQSGQIIKIGGFGEAGPEGRHAGDLYVRVIVEKHPIFSVQGEDLIMEKDIPYTDILREKEFEIKTVDGRTITFSVPPKHNLREDIVIPKEGMGKKGNLILRLNVKTPKKINTKAKKILDDLADELGE